MTDGTPDALMRLVPEIELPETFPTLRTGDPDRLGAVAAWWGTVSTAGSTGSTGSTDSSDGSGSSARPDRVTLAWTEVPAPGSAPGVLATLVGAGSDVPAGIEESIGWGAEQADRAIDAGADLVVLRLPPELPGTAEAPGAAELPAHVLLAAHLLQVDPVEASGWPGEDGLTDLAWTARVAALRDGRRRIRGIYGEPQRLLEALDARWLAAGAGLLARTTARRTPTLLDGPASAACGLLVRRAEAASRAWWQATDIGDSLHTRVLKELRLEPLLHLDLESGPRGRTPGLGGLLGLAMLESALGAAAAERD